METASKIRFRFEALTSASAFTLALVTVVSSHWIETVFGFDPDHGNGAVEWVVIGLLCMVALSLAGLARRDLRRLAPAPADRPWLDRDSRPVSGPFT